MNANRHSHSKGFSLIEMLLVMVIIAAFIYMGAGYIQQRTLSLRIDRTSGQMQQVLNASMVYYINTSTWPNSLSDLTSNGYLPTGAVSPWGTSYNVYNSGNNLYVSVLLPAKTSSITIAKTIVGTLPFAFTSTSASATTNTACTAAACYVIATVTIPGQTLSGANSVNFAGLYHSGSCVPEPTCPTNYTAQVIAVPVAVNGFFDAPTGSPCNPTDKSGCSVSYKPVSGFTAYATDNTASTTPVVCSSSGSAATAGCTSSVDAFGNKTAITGTNKYWRVCLSVMTESGEVVPAGTYAEQNAWGQLTGTIMVMTRCAPSQDTGSGFSVWEPNS